MDPYLRFALSQPLSCVVIGCDTIEQLEQNEAFARDFEPMSKKELDALVSATAPFARELMYYKP
jgi:aryl-alcohol dehydrogenase-like predicted oxidoreductase